MNWKQILCLLLGLSVIAGMLLCIPADAVMTCVHVYSGINVPGHPRFHVWTSYGFIPGNPFRTANLGVLLPQCVYVLGISCLLFIVLGNRRRKELKIRWEVAAVGMLFLSWVFFLIWFVLVSCEKLGSFSAGQLLPLVGFVSFFAIWLNIEVFAATKRQKDFFSVLFCSIAGLSPLIACSYWGWGTEYWLRPITFRLIGIAIVLTIWGIYGGSELFERHMSRRTQKGNYEL